MRYIYSDFIPDTVDFFTANKRYEIIDEYNITYDGSNRQVTVIGDDGKEHHHINIGKPCAYLNDNELAWEYSTREWSVENDEAAS